MVATGGATTEPSQRAHAALPGVIDEEFNLSMHCIALPGVESFLPSRECDDVMTASDQGYDEAPSVVQEIVNEVMAAGILGMALHTAVAPPRTRILPRPQSIGLRSNPVTYYQKAMKFIANKLRVEISKVKDPNVNTRLQVLMQPGLQGVNAGSYTESFAGWKRHVVDELSKLARDNKISAGGQRQLSQMVHELDYYAHSHWRHRVGKTVEMERLIALAKVQLAADVNVKVERASRELSRVKDGWSLELKGKSEYEIQKQRFRDQVLYERNIDAESRRAQRAYDQKLALKRKAAQRSNSSHQDGD